MTTPLPPNNSRYAMLQPHAAATDRNLGIGGSDANRIAKGDWLDLYNEKVGLAPAPDLSGLFRVQLGSFTEPFHVMWHGRQTECGINTDVNTPLTTWSSGPHDYMYASLDGWIVGDDVPLEVKHTNEHNNLRSAAQYYMAQLQHILLVTGCERMRFSIIRGNNEPDWGYVAADEIYQTELIKMEDQFWWHVQNKVPPEVTPDNELEELAPKVPINGFKPYDYSTNNHFNDLALTYAANKEGAARFEAAKKGIKELVPADASEVTCRHLRIVRSASGSLLFKEPT